MDSPNSLAQQSAFNAPFQSNAGSRLLRVLGIFENVLRGLLIMVVGVTVVIAIRQDPFPFPTYGHFLTFLAAVGISGIAAWVLVLVDGTGLTRLWPHFWTPRIRLRPPESNERVLLRHTFVSGGYREAPHWLHGRYTILLTNERFIVRIPGTIPQLCILDVPRESIRRVDVIPDNGDGRLELRLTWRSGNGTFQSFHIHPGNALQTWTMVFLEWGIPVGRLAVETPHKPIVHI